MGTLSLPTTEVRTDLEERWRRYEVLPCKLSVELAVPQFTVAKLMGLRPGTVIDTGTLEGSDVPLRVNGALVGFTEFEVIGNRLAVRITDLA